VAEAVSEPAPSHTPYRGRFIVVAGVVAVVALAAIGAALAMGLRGGSSDSGPWSTWKPSTDGVQGAQEIADHISSAYKLTGGRRLVAIKAGELKIPQLVPVNGQPAVVDAPFNLVQVVRKGTKEDVRYLDGAGILYSMCGLGAQCSIKSGTPSPQRLLVLRREALELGMYTLKYIPGVKSVVVLTPPSKDGQPTGVMVFRRDSLSGLLDRPVARTLPTRPPRPETLKTKDAGQLRALTQSHVFEYEVQAAPDGSALMVLTQGG
jgi:hypothetical protein